MRRKSSLRRVKLSPKMRKHFTTATKDCARSAKTSLPNQIVEGDLTRRAIPKDAETFTTAVTDFARRAIPKDEEKQYLTLQRELLKMWKF
jgi:hypothetical protein